MGNQKKFKFHLDIQVGESSIDYTALAKKEHLSDVEIRVRKLSDRITAITNEMHYQRKREEEFLKHVRKHKHSSYVVVNFSNIGYASVNFMAD